MYCPVCGEQSTQGLNYCKRCGSNLSQPVPVSMPEISLSKLAGMFWAIAVFGLGGLALLVGGALGVVAMARPGEELGIVVGMGFFLIFGISAMLIRQLSRLISMLQHGTILAPTQGRGAIDEYTRPAIASPPRPVSSVTENTTRNFEPAHRRETGGRQ